MSRTLSSLLPLLALLLAACRDAGGVRGAVSSDVDPTPAVIAVGDVADCRSEGDEATARIVDTLRGTIALLGDNAYPNGTDGDYANCFDPVWGRHKARIRPTPGNHEYRTADAAAYFRYFGDVAGEPGDGWYSYDVGAWHVVVLNSSDECVTVRCDRRSDQVEWLRADLERNRRTCTLAYWHHPRFNSGAHHGDAPEVGALWDALYAAGVDVVLNGHEHLYERFAPQRPDGTADPARGIRQFTVGTGGRSHYDFGRVHPNSEHRDAGNFGVLYLRLDPDGYDWSFVQTDGRTGDAGRDFCH